jgi:hypothetical protein
MTVPHVPSISATNCLACWAELDERTGIHRHLLTDELEKSGEADQR